MSAPSRSARRPSPRAHVAPAGAARRFLFAAAPGEHAHARYAWSRVLWLTGVDYFSTLGYQPAIAFVAAGVLSPIATLFLIAVTLFGALPVYAEIAKRSYAGQGSLALLERLVPGWGGKAFVLVLLGFAATDFVITMTLSASDAAQHAVENPLLHGLLGEHRLPVAIGLLLLLGAVFLAGFREAIGVAALACVPYLALNVAVIARAGYEVVTHPQIFPAYRASLAARGDWPALLVAGALVFPRLALGMSGFETGVSVMPLVKGDPDDGKPPAGRIRNTRKLLFTAAAIMSVLLLLSSFVTTTLIPEAAFQRGGAADGRALAYLAHEQLGSAFGSVYDFSTILTLWFAGASAMAAMLNLVPRYLPRFGMAPRWVEHPRPLVLLLVAIDVAVTVVFKADVEAQGGAYATGVMVLLVSAGVAVALALGKEARATTAERRPRLRLKTGYYWAVTLVLTFTLVDNVIARYDGVLIAALFIFAILTASGLSRVRRATELRVDQISFADDASREAWSALRGKKVNLVPVGGSLDPETLRAKVERLRRDYRAEAPIAFVHVDLTDDTSEFRSVLSARVSREGAYYLMRIQGAVAIPNTLAWVSEALDPIAIYLELSLKTPLRQAIEHLLWGGGEVGILVYEILVRYWHSTPEDDERPLIFLVSR